MKKDYWSLSLLLLISACILFFLFKPVLQHPDAILFGKTIDPIKSYFNFGYYLKFDSGIKHDGINYPYGDHLQYINSHPIFVRALKWVDQHLFPLATHGVGILNLSMILAFIPGILLLYLLLLHFKVNRWFALVAALLIAFLNPQFDRIHGHFEMVYWFFIPLFWYLLIRFREKNRPMLWGSLMVLSGIIGGFISAYFVAFYSIFILTVLLGDLILARKDSDFSWKAALLLLVLAILPLLVVRGFVGLTDWVDDRPTNPYGFFVYHANIPSIFWPSNYPLKSFLHFNYQWEGRAFIGVPAVIVSLWLAIQFIRSTASKKMHPAACFLKRKNLHHT